jgi:hypothetical protein
MSRPLLALVLAAGLAYAPTLARAQAGGATDAPVTTPAESPLSPAAKKPTAKKPTTKKTTIAKKPTAKKPTAKKPTAKKSTSSEKSKLVAKKSKNSKKSKKSKKALIARTPTASSLRHLDNMPRGYAWPPTEQMLAAEKACEAQLDAAGIVWKPAEAEGRIVDALTVTDDAGTMTLGGITYRSAYRKGPHKLDCQLALALHEFGKDLYATGVREIKFGSIYRWTNVRVNGETKNILSRHALGIAMDIVSLIDDTGREAVVEKDYPKNDPLLLAVETVVGASGRFRVLLTPKNDPISHHDHFHLEVAVDYTRADHTALVP